MGNCCNCVEFANVLKLNGIRILFDWLQKPNCVMVHACYVTAFLLLQHFPFLWQHEKSKPSAVTNFASKTCSMFNSSSEKIIVLSDTIITAAVTTVRK